MDTQSDAPDLTTFAAEIVSAYVANNTVTPADLPALISDVHRALTQAGSPAQGEPAAPEQKASSKDIKRSITPDHLVSFEDGSRYKSLKRHLAGRGLTPQQYRDKWGLPADYPMVAPNYSAQRSELARSLGLGRKRGEGLAKMSPEDALRVEALNEAAEQPEGEAEQDDPALAAVIASEPAEPASATKPARKPRAKKPKDEAAAA